nr:AAA family ATPase [Pseudomonas sp. GW460-12]
MPTLHLLCGKIAAGKSTLAKELVAEHAAILLSEDTWLAQLYPGEVRVAARPAALACAHATREVLQVSSQCSLNAERPADRAVVASGVAPRWAA